MDQRHQVSDLGNPLLDAHVGVYGRISASLRPDFCDVRVDPGLNAIVQRHAASPAKPDRNIYLISESRTKRERGFCLWVLGKGGRIAWGCVGVGR